jgi:hypothetical protein
MLNLILKLGTKQKKKTFALKRKEKAMKFFSEWHLHGVVLVFARFLCYS